MATSARSLASVAIASALAAVGASAASADPLAGDPLAVASDPVVVAGDPLVAAGDPVVVAGGPGLGAPGVTAPGDEPAVRPPRPRSQPAWQIAAHGALRVTRLDEHAGRFADQAEAYGWRTARATPLLGGSLDVSYLHAPIVDLGITAGWMSASYAAGVDVEGDRLNVTTASFAATARLHWAGGRPFVPEPRLDAGVLRERIEIHGTTDSRVLTYLRAGVDWRLGTRAAGVSFALGYTMVDRDPDQMLPPPIGGLDLAVGPYVRF